jgi:tetratricopeptide (TPR) repeat protein
MRRAFILSVILIAVAAPVCAQIGKQVAIQAGTPEDKALAQISKTADAALKLQLIEKFFAEFGKGDTVLVAYDLFMNYYLDAKSYDKVFEYGEKALALDPDNFGAAFQMYRAAQEKGDADTMFDLGQRIAAIVARFRQQGPPPDVTEETWTEQKNTALERAQPSIDFVEYTLFNLAYQSQDAAKRTAFLERFANTFPESQFAGYAEGMLAAAFQLAQDYPKMLTFAQKALKRDANNVGMLILLCDYWSEKGEELDKAEEYANKVIELLNKAEKPAQLTDEQWQQQKSIQLGLAQSALGQVHINRDRLPQALDAFRVAKDLLRADKVTYARNLYRLGFTLAKMNRPTEARPILTEAVSIDSPYKALAQDTLNRLGPVRPPKKRPEGL